MRKFSDWTIKDSFPKKELVEIEPISLKIFSLISRNKDHLDKIEGAVELLGALSMIEALDYHFANFLRQKDSEKNTHRIHEIVAYLNRIGQIYYFIKSDYTKNIIKNPENLTPKINELKVFRMKNTAHRSIDYPKGETSEYRNRQALTFIGFQVNYHMNYEQFVLPIEKNSLTEWNYFIPEIDHPKVMKELYNLITKIVKNIA